jgi:hypothetical protein
VLLGLLLSVCAAAAGQTEDETAVLGTVESFFAALREARGSDAASLYSSSAMDQVELTFDSIREGIEKEDESVLLRLGSAGYSAPPSEIRDWNAGEYLSATLELPIMSGRYTPLAMRVDSMDIQGRRALVFITFENRTGASFPQQAVLVREDDQWFVEAFLGMTSFP